MRLECQHHGRAVQAIRLLAQRAQNGLMSEVDTVKIANRQAAAVLKVRMLKSLQTFHDGDVVAAGVPAWGTARLGAIEIVGE
jgi:hypothetical protein